MTDPVMLSVASAVAGKTAEAAVAGGKTALATLIRLVRDHLGRSRTPALPPGGPLAVPEDAGAIAELSLALERLAGADPEFAGQLRTLWPRVQAELSVDGSKIINTTTGTVGGHLVQARDLEIRGGLHLGDVGGPPQT